MTYLDELVERATKLVASGTQDNELALTLNEGANEHFGSASRDPNFIKMIQLSNSLREKKEIKWENKHEILGIESVADSEKDGYFFISGYGFGKVDLYKDGKFVHRMYGIGLKLSPGEQETSLDIPARIMTNFDAEKNNRGKFRRGEELLTILAREINEALEETPCASYSGILLESHFVYGDEKVVYPPYFEEFDGIPRVLGEPLNKAIITESLENIAKALAKSDQHIRQVGSVIDGGSRYKR